MGGRALNDHIFLIKDYLAVLNVLRVQSNGKLSRRGSTPADAADVLLEKLIPPFGGTPGGAPLAIPGKMPPGAIPFGATAIPFAATGDAPFAVPFQPPGGIPPYDLTCGSIPIGFTPIRPCPSLMPDKGTRPSSRVSSASCANASSPGDYTLSAPRGPTEESAEIIELRRQLAISNQRTIDAEAAKIRAELAAENVKTAAAEAAAAEAAAEARRLAVIAPARIAPPRAPIAPAQGVAPRPERVAPPPEEVAPAPIAPAPITDTFGEHLKDREKARLEAVCQ